MTIKLTLGVDPVHETASIHVKQTRKDPKPPYKEEMVYDSTFVAPAAPGTSQTFEVEIGDLLTLEVSAAQSIAYDKEQFVVRTEPTDAPHVEFRRKQEAEEREKAEQEVEEDKKARAKEGERLDKLYRKEAEEQKAPVKAVPAVPPLPKKDDPADAKTSAEGESSVPPKGGAKDSKEVKAEK